LIKTIPRRKRPPVAIEIDPGSGTGFTSIETESTDAESTGSAARVIRYGSVELGLKPRDDERKLNDRFSEF
jgi:hypothetical protein